jgi:hypothetical protein
MSMQVMLYAVPANVVPALLKKEGFAEELVGDPEAFGAEEFSSSHELDYRMLQEVGKGKKWLTLAFSETGAKVGDDFGYGPGILTTAEVVAKIAKGLASEWKDPDGPLVDLLAFYAEAARGKKAVLMTVS